MTAGLQSGYIYYMEADGITRIFLIKDRDMGESMFQVYSVEGPELNRDERRDVFSRADIIYTVGGIVWDHQRALVIENKVDLSTATLETLRGAAEVTFKKAGLTIVIDHLSPEDMRYAGENYDDGDSAL